MTIDQQNTIYENLVFSDAQATPALARVQSKIGAVAKGISGLRVGLLAVGGMFGVFQVRDAIANVGQLYERVRRLKAAAGVTAETAHALTDAFDLTGTESTVADSTIVRLARLSQRASGAGKEAQKLKHTLTAVGVDMKHGVEASFLSMSEAVTKGRLGVNEMARTFKIPLAQAGQLMGTLKQGPERLRAIIAESLDGADLVDEAALRSYEQAKQAKLELADAWEGLVGTVYKSLLPGVTAVVHKLTAGMKEAEPIVTFIGKTLATHMDLVVASAKAYVGYLIAAKAIAATTGGGTIGGFLKGQMGGVLNFGPRAPAAPMFQAGRQLPGAARAINAINIGSQFAGRGGLAGVANSVAQIAARFSPMLGRLLASTVSFRALFAVIGRFMLIGTVIAVAGRIFTMLKNDVGGFRTRIGQVLGEIVSKFQGIGRVIKPVLSLLTYVFGKVLTGIGYVVLGIFEGILRAVNFVLTLLRAIVNVMHSLITSPLWSIRHPIKLFTNAWADAAKSAEKMAEGAKGKGKAGKGTTEPPPNINQDFRGSTFNVTNQFAEGFDVGRVSVAFTEQIAAAGQRRIQSGFAPTFAVRGSS